MQVKGLLIFPTVFTPKIPQGSDVAKYSTGVLFPPNDPQVALLNQTVNTEKQNCYPNGFPANANVCFEAYDVKYHGKDYYDPKFTGWFLLTCTSPADEKPVVMNQQRGVVMDSGEIYSGVMALVDLGITGYSKGTGGVGGWLNGIMVMDEAPYGRLDGKKTAEQMFIDQSPGGAVAGGTTQEQVIANQNQQVPVAPGTAPAAPANAVHQMTAKANGATYETMLANNWTDATLIEHGMMVAPGGVAPAFTN